MNEISTFVLAGGLGTRLRPSFDSGPKAMATIAGKPFLYYLLRSLQLAGMRRVVLCVGYRHDQIREWAQDGKDLGLDIRYSVEDQSLGTGGGVALAVQRFAGVGTLLVVNGDSLAEVDFARMCAAHLRASTCATVALVSADDPGRFGRVEISRSGCVRRFTEKCDDHGPGLISCGVCLFERRAFEDSPADRAWSLEKELLPALVRRGELHSFPAGDNFIDIGTPGDFVRAADYIRKVFQLC
jgi:NDP-sugar pyrophosphorylase family protein